MKAGMTFAAARAAAAKSGGMFVVLTGWSAPTSEKVREKRREAAAGRAAEHRAIGRVKVEAEAENGVVLFRVAGQVNRDEHPEGVYLNKKGEPCVGIVIGAPTEYGYTTACPYAGKEGSACENRRPFHAHRTVNLSRLVAWEIAGEQQPLG
jgi:hypothetical protein